MKQLTLLILLFIAAALDNFTLKLVHAEPIPTINKVYEEHGIQKEVDVSLPSGTEAGIKPGSKGRVYTIDEDDKTESLMIADIEVLSITPDGLARAKRTKGSNTIKIKEGDIVKFLPDAESKVVRTADTIAPTGSISINNSAYTNSRLVTLSLYAADNIGVIGYHISASPTPPSAVASSWKSVSSSKNYAEDVSYTLSSGDGRKTIYVWYKDAAGNISASANDSIVLDTTAPTITITSPTSDSTYTTTTSPIRIGGIASDNASGIRGVRWSNSKGESWLVNGTTNWLIPGINLAIGNNSITVTATDAAGNTSTDMIIVTYNKISETAEKTRRDAEAYLNNGNTNLEKGYYDHAISDYSKAIQLDPKFASAYNNRGYAYYKKGEYDYAWTDINKAKSLGCEVEPEFLDALRKAVDGRYNSNKLSINQAEMKVAKKIYEDTCELCHGSDGKGSKAGKQFGVPDFTSPYYQGMRTDAQMKESMLNGTKNPNYVKLSDLGVDVSKVELLIKLVRGFNGR